MNPTSPNHALQRTGAAVTARASAAAFPPAMHGPRQPRPSLSLGSLGGLTALMHSKPPLAPETVSLLLRSFVPTFTGFFLAGLVASVKHLTTDALIDEELNLWFAFQYGWFISAIVSLVPGLVLGALAAFQKRAVSPFCTLAVVIGWLGLVFLMRARKPWDYYGEFPWFMLRAFVPLVPVSLAFAFTFMVTSRWLAPRHEAFGPSSTAA